MHKGINGFLLNTILQCLKQETTFLSELVTMYTQFDIPFVLIGSETQITTFGYVTEWTHRKKFMQFKTKVARSTGLM